MFKNYLDLTKLQPVYFADIDKKFSLADIDSDPPNGIYAQVIKLDDAIILRRDPLGIHKLFYGKDHKNRWVMANRIHDLLENNVECHGIYSCPPGGIIKLVGERSYQINRYEFDFQEDSDFDFNIFQNKVKITLENTFTKIKNEFPDSEFVVCLSGGMDSAIIASLAKRFLPNLAAWSFTFVDDNFNGNDLPNFDYVSDDFKAAIKVAQYLGIPFQGAFRKRAAVKEVLEKAIKLGQDWRDFNAHCAVVNLFLAEDIRNYYKNKQIIVLTGDLMNEFVCDYSEEFINGTIYYRQPKVNNFNRRKFFVKGLDAGDREVGVFAEFDIRVIQPYAAVCQDYLRIPSKYLDQSDIKQALNGCHLNPELQSLLNTKKTRAQVGGKDGGVLKVCNENNIGDIELRKYWCKSYPKAVEKDMLDLIQLGAYRR